MGNGESQKIARNRMLIELYNILDEYRGKRILIVGHSTATAYLLSEWCEVSYTGPYKFNGKEFFDGTWKYCETFKLIFNENNELISIENIKNDIN